MICVKCKKEAPDGAFCALCGAKQEAPARNPKRRGNGQGSVYKDTSGKYVAAKVKYVAGQRITTAKYGFATKKAAYACLAQMTAEKKKENPTFYALYENWAAAYEHRIGESTMRGHKAAFQYFRPLWPELFAELCTADLQKCIDACQQGRRTKENMKSLASLLYKYAGANKIVTHNYAQYLYVGADKQKTRRAFTPDEISRIQAAIGKLPYADYVFCMICTGFRPGEMLNLPVTAYDAEKKTLTGGSKTEAGRNRCVTIAPVIQPIIDRLAQNDSAWLFPTKTGKRFTDSHFRQAAFEPLMQALKINDVVPYSCRHTFANFLKKIAGADTDKAALMGHADIAMTKYYQSPDYDSLRAITDAITGQLLGDSSKT